jgi:hypothetical protein
MITASFTENYQNKHCKTDYVWSWTIVQLALLNEPQSKRPVRMLSKVAAPFTQR